MLLGSSDHSCPLPGSGLSSGGLMGVPKPGGSGVGQGCDTVGSNPGTEGSSPAVSSALTRVGGWCWDRLGAVVTAGASLGLAIPGASSGAEGGCCAPQGEQHMTSAPHAPTKTVSVSKKVRPGSYLVASFCSALHRLCLSPSLPTCWQPGTAAAFAVQGCESLTASNGPSLEHRRALASCSLLVSAPGALWSWKAAGSCLLTAVEPGVGPSPGIGIRGPAEPTPH